ncbi:MAG: hypothetical protein WD076_10430 [Parvularculaceae bacterium]
MRAKSLAASYFAFLLIAAAPLAARADGTQSSGVRLQLGGGGAAYAATKSTERGVTVWRATPSIMIELLGDDEALIDEAPSTKEVVVVHHFHSRMKHLRTQGFYSGHPGCSRRFTQGFYSGPVDKGRSSLDFRCRQ